jgi:hypothetical protein
MTTLWKRRGLWIGAASTALVLTAGAVATRYELVLRVRDPVSVQVLSAVPIRAPIAQRLDIRLDETLRASAELADLTVPLDETLEVPLDVALDVPISATVQIAEPLHIALDAPVRMLLTERELGSLSFDVPIDSAVFVNDIVEVDTVVPLDTHVTTALGLRVPVKADVPIHARIPIKQRVRVQDRVHVTIAQFRIPLQTSVRIDTTVPIRDALRVTGTVHVPLKQRLRIPLHQTLHPRVAGAVPVTVKVAGSLPAEVRGDVHTDIRLAEPLQTTLGAVHVSLGDLQLAPLSAGHARRP